MDLVQLISQVGFPIAVASYCLVVLNKSVQEHTKATMLLASKFTEFESCLKAIKDGGNINE